MFIRLLLEGILRSELTVMAKLQEYSRSLAHDALLAREGKWLSLLSIRNYPHRYLHVASQNYDVDGSDNAGMGNSMAIYISLHIPLPLPIFF